MKTANNPFMLDKNLLLNDKEVVAIHYKMQSEIGSVFVNCKYCYKANNGSPPFERSALGVIYIGD